jgi:DHA1 family tetracycline resistance protein-like MFS transporter
VLVGRIVASIGERRALLLGLACGTLALSIYGLAPTRLWFLLGIPMGALWGLVQPAAQAVVTRAVDPTEQGRLQGAIMSVTSLAGIVSPFLLASVFSNAIGRYAHWHLPGAAFLVAAVLLLAALVLAACVVPRSTLASSTRTAAMLAPIDG